MLIGEKWLNTRSTQWAFVLGDSMADNVKWLKLMNNMFEDEKIEYIESLPDGDMILNVWIKTLCLASKCNDNGNLTITSELPYTTTLLAHKFKKTVTQIEYAFKIMQALGMVEVNNDILCVSNWCKYQNVDELERLKEQNRLRVAKCREKKKESNVTVMLQCNDFALNSNSISNNINIVTNEEIDTYFDKIYSIYPRKVSKVQAKETFEHKLRGLEKEEAYKKAIAIYRMLESQNQVWQAENDGQGRKVEHTPNFSSWCNDNVDNSPHFKKGRKR